MCKAIVKTIKTSFDFIKHEVKVKKFDKNF